MKAVRTETKEAKLLNDNLELVQQVIGQVANQRGLGPEEREEFHSTAWLRMIENAESILGGFRGDCELRTYLFRVIDRVLLDYRISKWGKWRPSAHARRSGARVRLLERLLQRDRHSLREAVAVLRINYQWSLSSTQITDMAQSLPDRQVKRRPVGEREIEQLADPHACAEKEVQRVEKGRCRGRAQALLRQAFFELSCQERQLLRMHFKESLNVADIARRLGRDQKRLYRKVARCLDRLRSSLESRGLCKEDLPMIIGCKSGELQPCLASSRS